MANSKTEIKKEPPHLGLPKMPSIFSGGKNMYGRVSSPKSFIPPPVRVTQNKGSGGK
ncbi:MAG: hypothetical protein AAB622_01705 [Patescibacteria group bacterium]